MTARGKRRAPAATSVAGAGPAGPAVVLVLLLAALIGGACRGGESPVGRLDATPSSLRLAYPEVREVTLSWEPTGPLGHGLGDRGGEAVVFVHLLDGAGKVVRTFDHPFPETWRPGTPVADPVALYQSALAPPLPAGSYALTVGLYRPGGPRWPLEVAVADRGRHEYEVGRVEVPASPAGGPRFDFVGAWEPPTPGSDAQVLAYRWLREEGTIVVGGPPGAGAVRLEFEIPEPDAPASVLVLAAGAPAPAVLVTTTCGDAMTQVTGAGHHALEVAVDPTTPALTGAAAACEVRLAPNFYLIATDAPVRRSVALQVLAWRPADDGGGA